MNRQGNSPFSKVWGASGVQNFFGEGYPFHGMLKKICLGGFDFTGMTFVAKTTTLFGRPGNMPLQGTMPRERFPKCIWVSWRHGIVLNAVSLSGPGMEWLASQGRWQSRRQPFQVSIMSVEDTADKRHNEIRYALSILLRHFVKVSVPFGIQINYSCPNVDVEHDGKELIQEIYGDLDYIRSLDDRRIYALPKLAATLDPKLAPLIMKHPACFGIMISNTIPFGQMPDRIDWKKYFPDGKSPLQKRGLAQAGGLSGKPLKPIVCDWIREARKHGARKHINGGGGILHPRDVREFKDAGADSVSLGSVAILRPWRVKRIIDQAYIEFGKS